MVEWDGDTFEAAVFNDLLAPSGDRAEVLATYTSSYYAGTPALICNHFGKGEAYYFGGAFAEDTVRIFLNKLGVSEPFGDLLRLPESCELAVREKEGRRYLFVLNYSAEQTEITLNKSLSNLLSEKREEGKISIEKYGVRVYKMQ